MFHLRGEGGGTVLNRDGKLRQLALKNEQMISAAVYGDFHPDEMCIRDRSYSIAISIGFSAFNILVSSLGSVFL